MRSLVTDISEPIDGKTSRTICEAVGERLQQNLRPESLNASPRLQRLLNELREQERQGCA
jgi:hypothetical protein